MRIWLLAAGALALPLARSVSQGAPTPTPPPVWRLTEDLRLGGADSGAQRFNDIRGIVATKTGTIFVLDYRTQTIRVFDDKGALVRIAADSGTGAGDIAGGNGLAVGSDDAVWVNDPRTRRFTVYRSNGQVLGEIPNPSPTSTPVWEGVIDGKGRAIDLPVTVITTRSDPNTHLPITESAIRFVRVDGKADSVAYPNCADPNTPTSPFFQFQRADGQGGMIRAIPFLPKQLVVVSRQGTIWCTPTSTYRLLVGPVGGALKEVVRIPMPPIPIDSVVRQQAVNRVDSLIKNYGPIVGGGTVDMIPRNAPFISGLYADDEGRAWARQVGMPDELPLFEVFDETGHVVASVHGAGLIGSQVFISGDELLTVTRNAAGAQVVIRYHITRS